MRPRQVRAHLVDATVCRPPSGNAARGSALLFAISCLALPAWGCADGAISLLAPEIAVRLQALGGTQQSGIDHGRAECLTNGSHRSPHRFQESSTRVLHQMPAVGDLNGLRCRSCRGPAIAAAAVARDDGDFGVVRQPGLDRAGLAVREEVDDTTPFEIADDAPVALPPLPGPIIDADDAQGWAITGGVPAPAWFAPAPLRRGSRRRRRGPRRRDSRR